MTEAITGRLATKGPAWLTIDRGLNLDGICSNSKCKAYNQLVCIPIGFGQFHMTMEVHKAAYPMCGKFCKNVDNMILYQAKCKSVGRVQGEAQERTVIMMQDKKD